MNALRTAVGEAADNNASVDEANRHGLSVTDAASILDRTTALLDREGLLEAVARGICEAVDLLTPDRDPNFYLGTDVGPAHVAAGLTISRPESLASIAQALRERGAVLLAGPSGSGKSAMLWMSAYENRHCRWYRVQQLSSSDDVTSLVRLARALLPTQRTPVGFVVDNVGQPGTEAWDTLVKELSMLPSAYVLGAAREEDLFLVSTLPRVKVVRLALEEQLAKAIYRELSAQGQTVWAHWREPYEQANGLLLEYTHLLSAGVRLQEVVGDQIQARRRENRDLELRILSVAGTAATWGAEVPLNPLTAVLGDLTTEVSSALQRLVGEHLLQQRSDGTVAGLHRLRSRAIFDAIHDHPPPAASESITKVIGILDLKHLQSFLVGMLAETPELLDETIAAIAVRVEAAGYDAGLAAAALQGLRIVDFLDVARQWLEILDQEGVPSAMRSLAASFGAAGVDLDSVGDWIDPRVPAAMRRMRSVRSGLGSRARLLGALPLGWMPRCLVSQIDCQSAAKLLAALEGMGDADAGLKTLPELDGSPLDAALAQADVRDLPPVIGAARSVAPETAYRLTIPAGGPESVLTALERATPWCRRLQVGRAADGLLDGRDTEGLADDALVARVEFRYISDDVHEDVHAATVELTRMIAACHPGIELVRAVATDAREKPHGFGDYEIANKWLRRNSLLTDDAIAWNRARIRTFESLVAAESHTDRVATELDLIQRTTRLLQTLATIWVTGRGGSKSTLARLATERTNLIAAVDDLPPPPIDAERDADPLDLGTSSTPDHVQGLLRTCLVNVISGLLDEQRLGQVASLLADAVTKDLVHVSAPDRWRILGFEERPEPITQLTSLLSDLCAITSELAFGDTSIDVFRTLARAANRSLALTAAAARGRRRADERFQEAARRFMETIEHRGGRAEIVTRAAEPPRVTWPPLAIIALMHVKRLDEWAELAAELPDARAVFSSVHSVSATPVREGVAIPFLTVAVYPDKLIPAESAWDTWRLGEHRALAAGACSAFRTVLSQAAALSGVAALPGGIRPGVEEEAVERLTGELNAACEAFEKIVGHEPEDPLLIEARSVVDAVVEQLKDEFESLGSAGQLAAALLDALNGAQTPFSDTITGTSILLAEWDVAPEVALRWYGESSGQSDGT